MCSADPLRVTPVKTDGVLTKVLTLSTPVKRPKMGAPCRVLGKDVCGGYSVGIP